MATLAFRNEARPPDAKPSLFKPLLIGWRVGMTPIHQCIGNPKPVIFGTSPGISANRHHHVPAGLQPAMHVGEQARLFRKRDMNNGIERDNCRKCGWSKG